MFNINIMAAPGQLNGTGLTDAQFLKIFTGEILTAFDETSVMKGAAQRAHHHPRQKRQLPDHVEGTPILGDNKIMHGERIINIDDLLTADVFLYDLDEAKNHYDVRSEYSKQLSSASENQVAIFSSHIFF